MEVATQINKKGEKTEKKEKDLTKGKRYGIIQERKG